MSLTGCILSQFNLIFKFPTSISSIQNHMLGYVQLYEFHANHSFFVSRFRRILRMSLALNLTSGMNGNLIYFFLSPSHLSPLFTPSLIYFSMFQHLAHLLGNIKTFSTFITCLLMNFQSYSKIHFT